jgi:hypothetical protein
MKGMKIIKINFIQKYWIIIGLVNASLVAIFFSYESLLVKA